MKNKNKNFLGVLFAVSGGICWGFSGACAQYLFSSERPYTVDTNWLICIRLLLAGAFLLLISIPKQHNNLVAVWKNKNDLITMLVFSIFGISLCQLAYFKTVFHTNAATATVLQYTSAIFILLYTCLRFKKLPKIRETIAIVLTVCGTVLLATHGNLSSMAISGIGLLWGAIAALSAAAYNLIPQKIIPKYTNNVITGYGMLIGGIVLSLVFCIWRYDLPRFDVAGWIAMFCIVFVGTVLAFSLYMKSTTYIGAVKASMLASTEPIAAVLFSVFWLKTDFVSIDYIGFALIIVTVFLLAKKENEKTL